MLSRQCVDQFGQVAIHYRLYFVQREINPVVGNAPLREVVRANPVGTIAAANESFARTCFFGVLGLHLFVFESRSKHAQGLRLVAML